MSKLYKKTKSFSKTKISLMKTCKNNLMCT